MPRTAHLHARLVASIAPFVLALSLAPSAHAVDAKAETEAKKLATDAMDNDYLSLDLKKAKGKLQKAIDRCGTDKCSAATLGLLHRDLGVVLATSKDAKEAKGADAEFDAALEADPKGDVPKDYLSNAAVKKAWEAAKKRVKPAAGKPSGKPSSDEGGGVSVKFTTAPVGYELPVVVTVPKGVASVKVSFKTDAMDKYRALDAEKQGKVYVAIIPCAHTAAVGEIKYFVKAFDDSGNEVDKKGSVKNPETLSIVATMPDGEETPSLPGDKEPKQCGEQGDKKPEGGGCAADDECQDGLVCAEGDEGKKRCESGERKSKAKKESDAPPRLFIGVEGQIEFVSVGATSNLCNQGGWACSADSVTNINGRADLGPGTNVLLDSGGRTEGGTARGTGRVLATLDYFVSPRVAIGVRLGYAFAGNPTAAHKFSPLHAEARLHYFFNEATVRPFLAMGVGYGEIDAKITGVIVVPTDHAFADPNVQTPSNPFIIPNVNAYRTAGAGFVSVGTGAWIFLGSKAALNLGIKVILPLPNFSFAIAPELGLKVGF
jgi:hypothetical protein